MAWLVIIAVFVLSKPEVRSSIADVLKMAFAPKVAVIWIVYTLWILSFVWVANQVGIWLTILTKDTFVWSTTAGVVLLLGFTEATKPGYFRRKLSEVAGVVVIFEYFVNLASVSFLTEFFLQPILFLFIVAPVVAEETDQKKILRCMRFWFFAILIAAIVIHTVQTLYASRQTLDWELFALRAVWPMLLGTWVLVLVFLLAVVSGYEQAFLRLEMYHDKHPRLWKTKLGLVLALGIRLRWIREAAKGEAVTYHVAHTDSVCAAYDAAKRYRGS